MGSVCLLLCFSYAERKTDPPESTSVLSQRRWRMWADFLKVLATELYCFFSHGLIRNVSRTAVFNH